MRRRLDEAVTEGMITENAARDLRALAGNILEYISRKLDEDNKGKLVNSMGGRVLELPSDQLRYAEANGIRIGEAKGITIGEARGIDHKTVNVIRNMLLRGHKDEDIIAIAECTREQIDDVRKSLL